MNGFLVSKKTIKVAAPKARTILGNPDNANRAEDDFYTTPAVAVERLLEVEQFSGQIYEPACGTGSISRVLEQRFGEHRVFSSDLIDRGFGVVGVDFLQGEAGGGFANVITNPPFSLAQQFAERALQEARHKVALLLRLQFLEGAKRKAFFERTPLARVWVFSGRISCHRNGDESKTGGMMAHAWFVWDKSHIGAPVIGFLDTKGGRQKAQNMALTTLQKEGRQ